MKIKLRNSIIETDVADNPWKRMVGLSMSEKKNMFFPMPYESKWSLWMFAVKYPLKMIFIDKNKNVIDIKKAEPITSDPKTWKTYVPNKPCKYILETPFDLKVRIGDKLDW
ncbi:hypothetical protein A3K64_01665 [Candidatus Micrarchaeota archaeon RBG_16_36_9]|nr:MAG: hypothetical protein A3K64_01665 [Candidatus Micrarchaeota archaeon RBG_16_36_9]